MCGHLLKRNGFTFKQFFMVHYRCTMKVGTDAILLGAWASVAATRRVARYRLRQRADRTDADAAHARCGDHRRGRARCRRRAARVGEYGAVTLGRAHSCLSAGYDRLCRKLRSALFADCQQSALLSARYCLRHAGTRRARPRRWITPVCCTVPRV